MMTANQGGHASIAAAANRILRNPGSRRKRPDFDFPVLTQGKHCDSDGFFKPGQLSHVRSQRQYRSDCGELQGQPYGSHLHKGRKLDVVVADAKGSNCRRHKFRGLEKRRLRQFKKEPAVFGAQRDRSLFTFLD